MAALVIERLRDEADHGDFLQLARTPGLPFPAVGKEAAAH
jgi:hypothetical protein